MALYPVFSLVNHACVPNVDQAIDPDDGFAMTLTSKVDIGEGEEIHISYLRSETPSQPERRLVLWRSWKFVCKCQLCDGEKVVLKLGNLCESCQMSDEVTCEEANVPGTDWKCSKCSLKMTESEVVERRRNAAIRES